MTSPTDGSSRPERARDIRLVVDAIPALAWSSPPDGSVEFVNRRWQEYTGLSPEQSYAWGWKTAIHADDLPALAERWEAFRDVDAVRECEVPLRRGDGAFRWFLLQREPFRDESGQVVRWYGIAVEIEDRKQAENKLRQNEHELRQLIDFLPQHVLVQDKDGVLRRNASLQEVGTDNVK